MSGSECVPVTVEGSWDPGQSKTVKNKLLLYFQSKKKSGGGDCRVEAEEGAPRAAVFFQDDDARERVLARKDHQIVVENESIKLQLSSAPSQASSTPDPDSPSSQITAVVLDNVSDSLSPDLLSMLVENVSGVDESGYNLEIIWETNKAVVTFNDSADLEQFLSVGPTHPKIKKHGLSVQLLEEAKSIRVEELPPTVVKDMLEMYFEKSWALPDDIIMIPDEQAAIITFKDSKAVKSICMKNQFVMKSTPVKVYPYYKSLQTALYGIERPSWKMPEPFTERLHHVVWKFLQMKKLQNSINKDMSPHFCKVNLDTMDAKLSPLPTFLKQTHLTAQDVDNWMSAAQSAFRNLMSQYSAFECQVNAPAWKAVEKDVHLLVKKDAFLMFDATKDVLIVAGRADDIKRIRGPVENIILKTMKHFERQTKSISQEMLLAPALYYILKQDGLPKAAQDISPEMTLSYSEDTHKLTITGLNEDVYQTKSWVLEKCCNMSKRYLNVPTCLLHFLRAVDHMDLSKDLFTSQGISVIYTIDNKGVFLSGSSDRILTDAESKMKAALSHQIVDVEDKGVLKLPDWMSLKQKLLDSYNLTKKMTVIIQMDPEIGDRITVSGFLNPVKEVSRSLREFIANYSRVQETIRVQSCAVVQFIKKKKHLEWTTIVKDNDVGVAFDNERPKIVISGARLHVQNAKLCLKELTSALCTDTLTVDKPGAKKYFQSQGSMFLSTILSEFGCLVLLCPEVEDEIEEEEEKENYKEGTSVCYCKVQTSDGVLVSVSRADICAFGVDAVVNAANEDLQHIGGVAMALLKAAGPQLQNVCNNYVAKNGQLRPGDAIITDGFNLPCKCVVHAVGPRFNNFDKKTAVMRLKTAVKESLKHAAMANCSSVALPAISSGVFGFPVDLCAETIAQAVREYCDSPQGSETLTQIHLVDNNDETVKVLASAVNSEFSDLQPTMTVPQQEGGKSRGTSGYQQSHGRRPEKKKFGSASWSSENKGRGRGGRKGSERFREPRQHGEGGELRNLEKITAEGLKIVLHIGNIQDQTTDVIVNTIAENMNLSQGAVSKAILEAAGNRLQLAVRAEAEGAMLRYGEVVVTDGFKLSCQKVFHVVCPFWNNGNGQAEEELVSIIRFCLDKAERLQLSSLSLPAIGTGILGFPRDVVSRVVLKELHWFSSRKPQHLRTVAMVLHPTDTNTIQCFSREFSGQTPQRNRQREAPQASKFIEQPAPQSLSQSQQPSASFSPVSSPTLGVYWMQMGQLTLEVSSGDITKEATDVIINSSNAHFNLKAGVSKAILDSAGGSVLQECSQIVNSPGYKPREMIITSAGQLPSKCIIHVVGQNNPADIKDLVYAVLKLCEENKFDSVAFPALGTGQGGASPSAVADAMVDAIVEFVRKKHSRFVTSVKILIFQTSMLTEFHNSMKKRQGEGVEEKSFLAKIKDSFASVASVFGLGSEQQNPADLVLEKEEFEPTVFQLCADNSQAVTQAKSRINDLILAEQHKTTIRDPYINQLSQTDVDELKALQRELTIRIELDMGEDSQDPKIHLEGLTRDIYKADATIRDIIRKVERTDTLKKKALTMSGLVEWHFLHQSQVMVPFDMYTNLQLEEALQSKQRVTIKIQNETYTAYPDMRKAIPSNRGNDVELLRKDLKNDTALPSRWDDMKGDLVKLCPLKQGSQEYDDVKTEVTKNGLALNIIKIERVQNPTLWQNYNLMKKQLEVKNKHTNNERLLFHGTSSNSIDLINTKGFNRSYAGTHGAAYGKGSYFAVDPGYSARGYAKPDHNGHKRMYQARVLVGDVTQGQGGMITPPAKTSNTADLYDSVTDNTGKPTMFVVFNDIQAYPEYLITFT
ncbi:protein mono-ADP-ribosyltransferase PARP14-like isoform 2-T2 [Pholidichthys leucotaenia]